MDGPAAGAAGLSVTLVGAAAVRGRVGDAGAAGRRGGAGRRLTLDLLPFVPQGFGEVVVHRNADGEPLLRMGHSLITFSQAPLEVLVHHAVTVALRH